MAWKESSIRPPCWAHDTMITDCQCPGRKQRGICGSCLKDNSHLRELFQNRPLKYNNYLIVNQLVYVLTSLDLPYFRHNKCGIDMRTMEVLFFQHTSQAHAMSKHIIARVWHDVSGGMCSCVLESDIALVILVICIMFRHVRAQSLFMRIICERHDTRTHDATPNSSTHHTA